MKRRERRNVLRVLRDTIGKSQEQMATLAGCSRICWQSVERGRRPLTAQLAEKISDATGIGFDWLMAGDGQARMVARGRRRYTKKVFEQARADVDIPPAGMESRFLMPDSLEGLAKVVTLAATVVNRGDARGGARITAWRCLDALRGVAADLGLHGSRVPEKWAMFTLPNGTRRVIFLADATLKNVQAVLWRRCENRRTADARKVTLGQKRRELRQARAKQKRQQDTARVLAAAHKKFAGPIRAR